MNARRSPLQLLINSYSVPLLFVKEDNSKSISSIGGTALLWQSLDRKFVVSAAPVWRTFAQRRASGGRMSICVGLGAGTPASLLNAEPIAIDDDLDIVVLPAPPIGPARLGKKAFYRTTVWPIAPAMNQETVGFIGFPGEIRDTRGLTLETSSFYYENRCAVGSSGKSFLIGAFQAEPPVTVFHSDHAKRLADFGGVSGAPVFALRDGSPVWVGIVKRGAEDTYAGIQATPAHKLGSDGKIRFA